MSPRHGSKRTRSERDRKIGSRPRHKTFWIFCEGEKTEKNYFDRFKHDLGKCNIMIEVKPVGKGSTEVVRLAIEKKTAEKDDIVWAVFDKDGIKPDRFDNDIKRAERKGVRIAFSNPCFEVWFLLHFIPLTSPIDCDGCIEKLTRNLKIAYSKLDRNHYNLLKENQLQAIYNACNLSASACPPSSANPCTTVHILAQDLISLPPH